MMLALRMGRTLEELGNTMSAHEFGLWLELYAQDLWGEMREYERAGVIAATVANYAGMMRGKGSEAAKSTDFMPLSKAQRDAMQEEVEPDPVEFFGAVASRG